MIKVNGEKNELARDSRQKWDQTVKVESSDTIKTPLSHPLKNCENK